jgi:mono/diheme cytochrome c family protein
MRRVLLSALLAAACSRDGSAPVEPGGEQPVLPTPAATEAGAEQPTGSGASSEAGAPGAREDASVSVSDGGALTDAEAPLASDAITYQKHIRPLIVGNCVECHQQGGIGPSDLSDWTQVKQLAPLITDAVSAGRMPPWPARDACHELAESRALSSAAKELFKEWQADGFLEGNPADYVAPAPRQREDLGAPAISMKAREPFTPAVNSDTYRCFYLGTLPQDTYVTALDLIPGDHAEVHHIQLHRVDPEAAADLESADASDPGPGYTCSQGIASSQNMFSYRPGALAVVLNQGDAVYFKGGSGLMLQIHYNTQFLPSGKRPGPDASSVAMWTLPAGQSPERVVYRTGVLAPLNGDAATNPFALFSSSIPANAKNVIGQDTVPMSELSRVGGTFLKGEIVGMTPHAHSWATRMVAQLRPAGGAEQCLIDVPDWDFNWQLDYMFKVGVPYSASDAVHAQCVYDNTAENQPLINGMRTPVVPITFGEKTLDEMCLHYVWLRFPYAEFAAANR